MHPFLGGKFLGALYFDIFFLKSRGNLVANADTAWRARSDVVAFAEVVRAGLGVEVPLAVVRSFGVVKAGGSDGAVGAGQTYLGDDLEGDVLCVCRERDGEGGADDHLMLERAQLVPCTGGELPEATSALRRLPIIAQQMSRKSSVRRHTRVAAVHIHKRMARPKPEPCRAIKGYHRPGRGSALRHVDGVALGEGLDAVEEGGRDVGPDRGALGEPSLREAEVVGGDSAGVQISAKDATWKSGAACSAARHIAEGCTSDHADTVCVEVTNRTAPLTRGRARVCCSATHKQRHSSNAENVHCLRTF